MLKKSSIRIMQCCISNMNKINSEVKNFKTDTQILKNIKRIRTLNLRFKYYQEVAKRMDKELG